MATNPAHASDLQLRSLRTLSAGELEVGETLLDDAWNIIITRMPSVATRLDTVPSAAFLALVVQVECSMVLRVLTNPDGKREEHGDDYGYTIDNARSTGALYLSDLESDMLGTGDDGSNAFTIKPAGIEPDVVDEWV